MAAAVPQPKGEPANGTRRSLPSHVVADWLGNSPAIAERLYLKKLPSSISPELQRLGPKVGRRVGRGGAAHPCTQSDQKRNNLRFLGGSCRKHCILRCCRKRQDTPYGSRKYLENNGKSTKSAKGAAYSGALAAASRMLILEGGH